MTDEEASIVEIDPLYRYSQKDPNDWKFELLFEQFELLKTTENIMRNDIPTISMYNSINLENMHKEFLMGYTLDNKVENNINELLNEFIYTCPCFNHESIAEYLNLIQKH